MKLTLSFYRRQDVVRVAKELLGKSLCTGFDGQVTAGIITETEAYAGTTDRASHAFGGRRTSRTEVMYRAGGVAYVYLCYGVHSLFNIVTNEEDIPHAVLIRAIYPTQGMDRILQRRNISNKKPEKICPGPGTVSTALGIHYSQSGLSLVENTIWVEDMGLTIPEKQILKSPRIGVDYAGKDALLPYRYRIPSGILFV